MGEGIRIRFERRHSSFGVRSVNINKASCCARYLRFVAILRRKKDFFQFLMKSAYEVTKRTTPRKLHRVCTFIFLFICLHAFVNVSLSSIIAIILIIALNILLLSIIAISLMQWSYILIPYCLILFFLL